MNPLSLHYDKNLESKPSPDAEGCSDERFDETREQAFRENSAGRLMAAYREWCGTEGPGVLTREQLREDIERLMRDAVERAVQRMIWATYAPAGLPAEEKRAWDCALNVATNAMRGKP